MSFAAKQENTKYTYNDYLNWSDNEKWELIYGVPYNMSPSPSRKHQGVLGNLFTQFNIYLRGKTCKAYVALFDVRLPLGNKDEDIDTVVQPDIAIVCDSYKLDDKGCKGAPDLIIEILSPNTAKKDMKEKFYLYEAVGVKEYWIVDPHNETVIVYKLDSNGKYGKPDIYANEETVEVGIFEELTIDLKEVFT